MRTKGIFILLLAALFLAPLASSEAAPFYTEKTMKLIVTTKPGGGYDFYGRLTARFMQKYLPGSTIIVKNVPGAGDIIGTNEIYHAKPNGLTLGCFNRAIPIAQLVGIRGVRFDLAKMSWFGSAASEVYSLTLSPKYKTMADARKAPKIRLGSSGLGTSSHFVASLFIEMTGLKNFSISTGYMGAESELAMIRGELEGQFASWSSMESFVKEGNGTPVVFIGKKQPAGWEHIPMIEDVVTDKKYESVLALLVTMNILGRPAAGPPGIPADRLKVLLGAYNKAFADPELKKYAKRAKRPIDFTKGDFALKQTKKMLNVSAELKALIKKSYGIK